MEDKVANVYKEYKYLTWKIVLIMICLRERKLGYYETSII